MKLSVKSAKWNAIFKDFKNPKYLFNSVLARPNNWLVNRQS